MGFPGGSAVKNLPAMQESQETLVWSLCQEDPLEEGMAIHSRILAWGILLTGEPGRLQSIGRKESDTSEATDHTCILTNWIIDWFNDHFLDPHDVPVPHETSGITDTRSEMASLAQLLLTLLIVHSTPALQASSPFLKLSTWLQPQGLCTCSFSHLEHSS